MSLAQHKKDFGQFPTSVQASGASTATAMTVISSPDNGLNVTGSSATSISLRVRSTKLRTHECTITIRYGTNARPDCVELATPWTGTDPAA